MWRISIIALLVACLAGCNDGGSDPCADLNCGDHARCLEDGNSAECICDANFIDEGVGCIDSKQVDCLNVAPVHATSQGAQVEIGYTDAGGWSDPAPCAWACDAGYQEADGACVCGPDTVDEGGGCISTKLADCLDAAPEHATSQSAQVEISYTNAGGWSDPAPCAWTCDAGYQEANGACVCGPDSVDEGGVCISTKLIDCLDQAPEHATSTAAQVEISYTDADGWSDPAPCAWTCDAGWVAQNQQCADVDECTEGLSDCGANASCTNNDGGFSCACDPGYTGDGYDCVEACTEIRYPGEQVPLALYIMVDQSGSMGATTASGNTLWEEASAGIAAYVLDPDTAGDQTTIHYFPAAVADPCSIMNYLTPEVPFAPLPGAANDIITSLAEHGPAGLTPTSAALDGALQYSSAWAAAHPDHEVALALLTDGEPTLCDTNYASIAAIAATAANGDPPVRTFVIGLGTWLTELHAIAAGGDTGQAMLLDTTQDVEAQLALALATVRTMSVGCILSFPAEITDPADLALVGLEFTPGSGPTVTLPPVANAGSCSGDGWYFEDPLDPARILLCPDSCDTVLADPNGLLEVVVGCP